MRTVAVELAATGVFGGASLRLAGGGTVDVAGGQLSVELAVSGGSILIDEALLAVALLPAAALVAMPTNRKAKTGAGKIVSEAALRVTTQILGEGLRECGAQEVLGTVEGRNDRRKLRFEVLDAHLGAEPLERVSALTGPLVTMSSRAGQGVLAAIASVPLTTSRGSDWLLLSTILLTPAEVVALPGELRLDPVKLQRTNTSLSLKARQAAKKLAGR